MDNRWQERGDPVKKAFRTGRLQGERSFWGILCNETLPIATEGERKLTNSSSQKRRIGERPKTDLENRGGERGRAVNISCGDI